MAPDRTSTKVDPRSPSAGRRHRAFRRRGSDMPALAVPFWAVALALSSTSSACDAFSRDYDAWVDTLSTGLVRVYNRDLLRSSPEPDFALVEELRLGREPSGPETERPDVFGDIVGLAVDDLGRIYVADRHSQEIRVFGPQGDFLRRFGGRGDSPGEFQELAGVTWHRSGALLAMDIGARSVTALDSLGTVLGTAGHHDETEDFGYAWRTESDTLGFLYERDRDSPSWAGRVLKQQLLADFTLATVDTIVLPEREPHFDSLPTNWRALWSVDPDGSVWHGNTNRFRFLKVADRSDTTLSVELRRPAPRLEGRERDSLGAAWGLPSNVLPRYKAVLTSFHVARDGRIWAWNPHVHQTWGRWEVFDASGYHLGQVATPEVLSTAPPPLFGHGTITGVVENGTGSHYVVRLRVPEMN